MENKVNIELSKLDYLKRPNRAEKQACYIKDLVPVYDHKHFKTLATKWL